MKLPTLTLGCFLLLALPTGRAALITFETLAHSGAPLQIASPYVEQGYVLSSEQLSNPPGSEFWVAGSSDPRFSGSTAMSSQIGGATIVLEAIDDSAFTLFSVNLAAANTPDYGFPDNSGPLSVAFVGQLAAGGTTTQTFVVDYSTFAQQTFFFDQSFSALRSVSWTQESPYHQFDNICIDNEPCLQGGVPSSVPIPAPVALLGIGLAGIGFARRRKP